MEALASMPERELLAHKGEESEVKTIPAVELRKLSGIISVGGDALEDSERLYDE